MRQRSSYPKSFKAQVVQKCLQPGATVSSATISHGINVNVISKYLVTYRNRVVAPFSAFVRCKSRSSGLLLAWLESKIQTLGSECKIKSKYTDF
ncbi:transposase [Pseudomonas japonica]|uniref:Transposase n=1 Tax=Pseudomonas japonica TaxID=256466 RepID=A0A239C695_9PSED|nr:Transposase [Pseudomonas japonica]